MRWISARVGLLLIAACPASEPTLGSRVLAPYDNWVDRHCFCAIEAGFEEPQYESIVTCTEFSYDFLQLEELAACFDSMDTWLDDNDREILVCQYEVAVEWTQCIDAIGCDSSDEERDACSDVADRVTRMPFCDDDLLTEAAANAVRDCKLAVGGPLPTIGI